MTATITPGTRAGIPAYAALLARTFSQDAVTQAFFPPGTAPAARERSLRNQFTALMRAYILDCGAIDTATDPETGELLGVALWLGPNPKPSITKQLKEIPTWLRAVPSPAALPRIIRQQRIFNEAKPKESHWLLADIAVSSTAQGRGVGSALLTHRLNLIDQSPQLAYLEATTKASARLYARHGFQHRRTLNIDGTPCHTMIRPPR